MKISKRAAQFLFIFCGIAAISARAQETPQPETSQSGYETLIAASNAVLRGESGYPSPNPVPDKVLSPRENLRRQRIAVARNAPALRLFHRALQIGVTPPEAASKSGLWPVSKLSELARQVRQESDVRAANGDWNGALQARLDIVELGTIVLRGGVLMDDLVGSAIESYGLNSRHPNYDLMPLILHLDATQCHAGARRLAQIDAARISYAAIFRNQTSKTLRSIREEVGRIGWKDYISHFRLRLTSDEAAQFSHLSPEDFEARVQARFDLAAAQAALPFPLMPDALPPAPDKLTALLAGYNIHLERVSHERPVLIARLIQGALELRAIKLESGAYPARFAAPTDPFSGKPLIYLRAGEKYILYSFGPDGRDDKGRVETRKRTDFDFDSGTRISSVRRGIELDAKGDIVAPVF